MQKGSVIVERDGKEFSLDAKILLPGSARKAMSHQAWKIIEELAKGPAYPKQIAARLRLDEQNAYYHIKNLRKAGVIRLNKEENRNGVIAKYYELESPAFALCAREPDESERLIKSPYDKKSAFLEPFIENGKMNSIMIIGSPDAHGPMKARGKDSVYAAGIGIFLGGFIKKAGSSFIKLDTETGKEDMKSNLIVLGGPGVNRITAMLNNKMPVKFLELQKGQYSDIFSSVTKKTYPDDGCGIIARLKNPFARGKQVLVIAGRRSAGTRAAVLAIANHPEKALAKSGARVVEGYDSDSDGIIDRVEFLE